MNEKIEYWIDYWAERLGGGESKIYPLKMINPRTVLREFADEIEFNKLANKNNKKFFREIMGRYLNQDPGIQACLKEIFTLIINEFDNPRESYLLQLCKQAQKIFDSREYFNESVDMLKSILFKQGPLNESDKENIGIITKDILIELMEMGYSEKYVEQIPEKLFSHYEVMDSHIISGFPHQIPFPQGDNPDYSLYNEQVKNKINSLTDEDRVESLKIIGSIEPELLTYIFQIKGLRGNSELQIGTVLFYSPKSKRLVKGKILGDELFGAKDKDVNFLNAAVPVLAREPFSGFAQAQSLVVNALSILRFHYNSEANYQISPSYIAIRANGKLTSSSVQADKSTPLRIWHSSLDLTKELVNHDKSKIDRSTEIIFHKTNDYDIDRRIAASMHWYRRAKEAEINTDRLLWYWITIESLLQKDRRTPNILLKQGEREGVIDIALELLSRIRSKDIAFQRGWLLRQIVLQCLRNSPHEVIITISPEVAKKAGLEDKPGTYYLKDFIENIPDIAKNTKKQFLIDQLNKVYLFYTDSDYAAKSLKKEQEAARNELLLIYRIRNKIMHNAEYETSMLPSAITSVMQYSRGLLEAMIRVRSEKNIRTVEEAVSDILCEYDILMENIKSKLPITVLLKA